MPFDMAKFERAPLQLRRSIIRVDGLAEYFGEGEPCDWEVRQLTASELHRASEASRRQGSLEDFLRAIAANDDRVAAMRKTLGLSKDTPGEVARRLEMLVAASVAPVIDLPNAVKLAEHYPLQFQQITNEILELTGQGAELVKPGAASQPMTASAQA